MERRNHESGNLLPGIGKGPQGEEGAGEGDKEQT